MNEKGTISVHSENIFPIIKKFLYSDQDIFLRELIANGVDAIQKLKKCSAMGLYEGNIGDLAVTVFINKEDKTLTIRDNGIGMTAEEIKKYINQIAFSGATEFMEKYKEQGDQHQLIGFFGLGFYSAFMVASKVEIVTKSYQAAEPAAHWSCHGTREFEIAPSNKETIGTDVILHLSQEGEPFLEQGRIQAILDKHCRFLPIQVKFDEKVINNTTPLWTKTPLQLKKEDYLAFYKELYPFGEDPLFWIHLNIDFPFHLTGVLYFPKVSQFFEQKETIQLYARQVFITNDVKEVVPDFLRLLHGVIDSPDIPLNVSRSALQSDQNVKKINNYIAKKVAEKLETLFHEDRQAYENGWKDINVFIKYGMITHDKFDEKIRPIFLFQSITGGMYTLEEYKSKIAHQQTDKHGNLVVLYTKTPDKHSLYIDAAQKAGYDVLLLDTPIDTNFINFGEQKFDKVKFKGIDTDTLQRLIEKDEKISSKLTDDEQEGLKKIYQDAIQAQDITWSLCPMSETELPMLMSTPEMVKRMEEFSQTHQHGKPPLHTLACAINTNHPLAQKMVAMGDPKVQQKLANQAYQLAILAQGNLQGEPLKQFIQFHLDTLLAL